jgi:cyanate permease
MVPVDLVLIFWPRQFATRWEFYLASGLVVLLGCLAWIWWGQALPWLGPGLIGAGVATNFAGLLAYPPLVAPAHQVAQLSSVMLAVGYACAFLGPLLGGVAVDLGGGRLSPFIPITAAAAVMMAVSPAVPRNLPRRLALGEAG